MNDEVWVLLNLGLVWFVLSVYTFITQICKLWRRPLVRIVCGGYEKSSWNGSHPRSDFIMLCYVLRWVFLFFFYEQISFYEQNFFLRHFLGIQAIERNFLTFVTGWVRAIHKSWILSHNHVILLNKRLYINF